MTETVTITYLPIPGSNWQLVQHGETRQVVFTKRAADSRTTTAGAISGSTHWKKETVYSGKDSESKL